MLLMGSQLNQTNAMSLTSQTMNSCSQVLSSMGSAFPIKLGVGPSTPEVDACELILQCLPSRAGR